MRRRGFLLGALGVGGALIVGWSFLPPRSRIGTRATLPPDARSVSLNGWVRIGRDGTVIVAVPRSEMGQGVHTALPMLVAEELDVPLGRVRVEQAPIDAIFGNVAMLVTSLPFHPDSNRGALVRSSEWMVAKVGRELGLQITGGSASVRDAWWPMREAGAAARAMLLEAASRHWDVHVRECLIADGIVRHMDGRNVSFASLVEALRDVPIPTNAPLKDWNQFKLIGRSAPRLDLLEKVKGAARFGIDVRLPGMLYATVRTCPILGGGLKRVDLDPVLKMPGVVRVSTLTAAAGSAPGVAVVATSYWHAKQAIDRLEIEWDPGPHAKLSSSQLMRELRHALATRSGIPFHRRGEGAAALTRAARIIDAEYEVPYLAHATLEPMNCTAQFVDGRLRIWAPTQVPSILRDVAARSAGIDPAKVDVTVTLLGGGFGRRLEVDFVPQAVWIARDVAPAPVQLIWSREEDMTHDFYRPAAVARLTAGFDLNNRPLVWVTRSASDAIVPQYVKRAYPALAAEFPDKTTAEGLFDQTYEFPHRDSAHVAHPSPVPVGFWRSVGHSHNAFFVESFIDELAYAAGRDPFAYRRELLAKHPHYRTVLELAALKATWGRVRQGRAQGIALHESFGSIVAQVAEVSLVNGGFRVHRVVCAIDCGTVINPDIVAQQMEGSVIFGLTAALYGEITIRNGRVEQRNFPDYEMLRLAQAPVVETHILPSTAPPGGVGEPGVPPVAPAVANAIFKLTGKRLRSLPLRLKV